MSSETPNTIALLHQTIAFEWQAHRRFWLAMILLTYGVGTLFAVWQGGRERWLLEWINYALLSTVLVGGFSLVALELVRLALKRALNTPVDPALTRVRLYQIAVAGSMVVLLLARSLFRMHFLLA